MYDLGIISYIQIIESRTRPIHGYQGMVSSPVNLIMTGGSKALTLVQLLLHFAAPPPLPCMPTCGCEQQIDIIVFVFNEYFFK